MEESGLFKNEKTWYTQWHIAVFKKIIKRTCHRFIMVINICTLKVFTALNEFLTGVCFGIKWNIILSKSLWRFIYQITWNYLFELFSGIILPLFKNKKYMSL